MKYMTSRSIVYSTIPDIDRRRCGSTGPDEVQDLKEHCLVLCLAYSSGDVALQDLVKNRTSRCTVQYYA
jgi:hypothetical protein